MTCVRSLSVFVVAMAALASAVAQTRQDPVPAEDRAKAEPPALAWFQKNVSPFASDVPSSSEIKAFVEKLGDARLIGLGEATHGDHQSQLFKNHAIRELVRQGKIDSLMLEINRTPGAEIDAYVNEGKGDLVKLMLDSGIFGIWRTDDFANMILWLRAHVIRTGKPFRIYGIDCQEMGIDFRDALDYLAKHDAETAKKLRSPLEPMIAAEDSPLTFVAWWKSQPEANYAIYEKAALDLVAALKAHKESGKASEGFDEALYAANAGLQGIRAFEYEIGSNEVDMTKIPGEYFARRDVYMAENTVARLGAEKRAAMWAHDMHVLAEIPQFIYDMGLRTVGSELRRSLGANYVSVGFAWTVGSFHAKEFKPGDAIAEAQLRPVIEHELSCDLPGDLGEFLARVGPERFWVDLRDADEATKAWGALPYYRGWAGWGMSKEFWHKDPMSDAVTLIPTFDFLVYTRRISPSTTFKLPAKAGA